MMTTLSSSTRRTTFTDDAFLQKATDEIVFHASTSKLNEDTQIQTSAGVKSSVLHRLLWYPITHFQPLKHEIVNTTKLLFKFRGMKTRVEKVKSTYGSITTSYPPKSPKKYPKNELYLFHTHSIYIYTTNTKFPLGDVW
jgi:hypothetical protein